MKTIKTTKFPSLIYSNESSAQKDAEQKNLSVCKIVYVDDFDGKETFIGFGLTDGHKLYETKDFVWI